MMKYVMPKDSVNNSKHNSSLRVWLVGLFAVVGCSLVPTSAGMAAPALDRETQVLLVTGRYLAAVHKRVQSLWKAKNVPVMELHRRSAIIRFWIRKDGKLRRIRVVQKSDHKAFDKSLLKAVSKALPFPKPPALILKTVQEKGVEIMFRKRAFLKKNLPLKTKYKGKSTLTNWRRVYKPRPRPRKR